VTQSTGIPNLDLILGGGLKPGSIVFLAGGSGAGKTVLAQQICFTNGTPERPAVYYTMLGESHVKLLEHAENFEFFDRAALGKSFSLLNLRGVVLGDEGQHEQLEGKAAIDHMTAEISRSAIEERPSVVVIDSVKALRDITSAQDFRRVLFDLSTRIAHSGAILLLVGEYTADEVWNEP